MKKFLLSFLMFIFTMTTVWAGDVVFDFTNPTALNPTVEAPAASNGTTVNGMTLTNGAVSMTFDKGTATTDCRIWNSKGVMDLRCYNGSTMTISSTENITGITFAGSAVADINVEGVAVADGKWTGNATNVTFSVSKTLKINTITVTYETVSATAPAKPVVTATGTLYSGKYFADPISVAISAEEGDIYYTTGDADFSVDTWTKYETSIEINQTTTIRSVAYNGTESSSETTAVYNYVDVIDGIANLRAEFNAGEVALVNLTNAIVTGVYGSYTYIEEANAGISLYNVSVGLEEGHVLNGVVAVMMGEYNNLKQITSILDKENVTVTTGDVPTTTITIADYLANPETYESRHIKFENVLAVNGVENGKNETLLQGEDQIALYGTTVEFTTIKGCYYNVTGWGGVYNENRQLALNNVEDLELLTKLEDPELVWAADTVAILPGEDWLVNNAFATKSDAQVVYTSSNENVAVVDADGKITVKNFGHAVITATTEETEAYYSGNADFHLFVLEGNGTIASPYSVADVKYYYGKVTEKVWVKGAIAGYYNNNKFNAGVEGAIASNIALGDALVNIPVQLPSGIVRETYNLVDNAERLGTGAMLFGNIDKYFNVAGLMNVTDFSLDGVTGIESVEASAADAVIYDLAGRRVVKAEKGVYIINGKKVLVK